MGDVNDPTEGDVHTARAALHFNVPMAAVTKAQRRFARDHLNFGRTWRTGEIAALIEAAEALG